MRVELDLSDEGVKKPSIPAGIYPGEVSNCRVTTADKIFGENTNSRDSTAFRWEVTITKPGPEYGHKLERVTSLDDKAVREDGSVDANGQKRVVPDPDAAKKANYYLRENWLKPLRAPWEKSGFSTDDVIHCKGKFKVGVYTKDGKDYNRIEGVFPADEDGMGV